MTLGNRAFVFGDAGHCIAFGFGLGLLPRAPGTWGTLLALPLFGLCAMLPGGTALLWGLGAAFVGGGIWVCGRACRALGSRDDPGVVWDETAAFYLVLCGLPPGTGTGAGDGWEWGWEWEWEWWAWVGGAFVVFRFLDIVKPPPIGWLDRNLGGGWGVMADDAAAATGALAALWGAAWVGGMVGGGG